MFPWSSDAPEHVQLNCCTGLGINTLTITEKSRVKFMLKLFYCSHTLVFFYELFLSFQKNFSIEFRLELFVTQNLFLKNQHKVLFFLFLSKQLFFRTFLTQQLKIFEQKFNFPLNITQYFSDL